MQDNFTKQRRKSAPPLMPGNTKTALRLKLALNLIGHLLLAALYGLEHSNQVKLHSTSKISTENSSIANRIEPSSVRTKNDVFAAAE